MEEKMIEILQQSLINAKEASDMGFGERDRIMEYIAQKELVEAVTGKKVAVSNWVITLEA